MDGLVAGGECLVKGKIAVVIALVGKVIDNFMLWEIVWKEENLRLK